MTHADDPGATEPHAEAPALAGPPALHVGESPDVAATLEALVQMLCEAVAAERGTLLLGTSPGLLRIRAARGVGSEIVEKTAVHVGSGIAGGVAASGVAHLLRDAAGTRGGDPLLDYTGESALCVPLRHDGRVIGVVNLANKRGEDGAAAEFDEHDLALATSLAVQAARVIVASEAAADAEARRRLERSLAAPGDGRRESAALAVMGVVTDELLGEGPLDQVLHGIARRATALLGASRGSLMLRPPGSDELRIAAAIGVPSQVVAEARVRIGEGIAGRCAETGEALLIPDVRALGVEHGPDHVSRYRNQSAICVPLRLRDETLGVLSLNDRVDGKEFTHEDLFVARVIARQAALAIRTSRLVEAQASAAATRRGLDVAREIQQAFVPPDLVSGPVRLAGLSIPADAAGGDYVDFWPRRDAAGRATGELVLAIGDASGHGLGSALIAASCRASLRALLLECGDLAEVLHRLDGLLQQDLRGGQFMTLFLALLDPTSGRLAYASAGHPPALLVRHGEGVCGELRATGPPLGLGCDAEFPVCESWLDAGDALVAVTDGVCDARDAARECFGEQRLHDALRALADAAPRALLQGLQRRVAAHTHPTPLGDDLSVLVLRLDDGGQEDGS